MQIRAALLNDMVSICEAMNRRSKSASVSNSRVLYARSFFHKGTFHGRSVCLLVEPLKHRRGSDLAGICALARSLIEVHNVFIYIAEPRLSLAEQEFRIELMHLNQAHDLLRISKALGLLDSDSRMEAQRMSRDHSLDVLTRNSVFSGLDKKQQTHLMHGGVAYLMNRYTGTHPLNRETESAVYNLFSHNVHSYGLSSSYAGTWTPAGYMHLLFLAVEVSLIYLAHLAKQYQALRGRAVGAMPQSHRAVIDDVLRLSYFDEWKAYLAGQGW